MKTWLKYRGIAEDIFRAVRSDTPIDWAREPKKQHGIWYKCLLKQKYVRPGLHLNKCLPPIKLDDENMIFMWIKKGSFSGQQFDRAIHASSCCSLAKILKHGLVPGPATKMGVHSIYCFPMSKSQLWRKSSGYVVCSELFGDNIY